MRRHVPKEEEVPLSGLLADFRSAVRSEISAASKSGSGSTVSLINGRRIAQVGAAYQYVFDIENALNLPTDMPGDLVTPDGLSLETSIISIEGLTVTLSVPKDMGAHVPSALLKSDLTFLMRQLIARIESLADKSNPVGDRMLGREPVSGIPDPVQRSDLNPEQADAVASSIGRNMTFIEGPPGTGKTRIIGAICEELYRRNRSVLLVSHTNTAVDQALLRINKEKLHPNALEAGQVIRVGEPTELLNGAPLLLAEEHKQRRAKELAARRGAFSRELEELSARAVELSRQIAISEWLPEARSDIEQMSRTVTFVLELEKALETAREQQRVMEESADSWVAVAKRAKQAIGHGQELSELDGKLSAMSAEVADLQEKLKATQGDLNKAENLLASATELAPLRDQAKDLPGFQQAREDFTAAEGERNRAAASVRRISARLREAEDVYLSTSTVTLLTRKWRGLPNPEEQFQLVKQLRVQQEDARRQHAEADTERATAQATYNKVAALHAKLAPYHAIPDMGQQQEVVTKLTADLASHQAGLASLTQLIRMTERRQQELVQYLSEFRVAHSENPETVLQDAETNLATLKEARSKAESLLQESMERRTVVEEVLSKKLTAIVDWGLVRDVERTAEAMLSAITAACDEAAAAVEGLSLDELRRERSSTNERIEELKTLIAGIDESLKSVEDVVVADARVVATTLTRAYLRDSIQKRRFDTVVLDEASMAPIPALWVAASLADTNVVVVGDPKQLPPIVISNDELAKEWLGKDIFGKSGVKESTDHLVKLKEQHRMHPQISAIPNALVYGRELRDCKEEPDSKFAEWYNMDWLFDKPVLLVDTEPVDAWVTSVSRGKASSRFNFLSATICVDIAGQVLRVGRTKLEPEQPRRILIVSPYRPHASLLKLLLKEQGLDNDVVAGTVHSFQGSEADVVILDLVNDEPHWRVGMFTPDYDASNIRLLNVALTRAKERLIIVGDFDYIAKKAKKAFIGRQLLAFLLKRYTCVDARKIVPAGLSARAAKAQTAAIGGEIEPSATRMVVRQDRFYPLLLHDLSQARHRVVIFSPFITQNRLGALEPQLKAAVERGAEVFVFTKTPSERKKRNRAQYRKVERTLQNWGITVVHKRGMHEKLVFVDDDVLWSGSLNPLSFINTQEIMERRHSREVVNEYLEKSMTLQLVGERSSGPLLCPSCGEELVVAEGRNGPYWRCPKCKCYIYSIGGPRYEDGIVRCTKCGGDVELGEWGDKYVWRCIENRRHRQNIARTHLRLPEMRKLIPKRILKKLDRQ